MKGAITITIEATGSGTIAVDCRPNHAELGHGPAADMARAMLRLVTEDPSFRLTIDKRSAPTLRLATSR